MLNLDSPRWSELQHAYGSASDIPDLLRQLERFPDSKPDAEPWFSLWSSLAHQEDVYSASFAAVPYIIDVFASASEIAGSSYLHFPAWIEICRIKKRLEIPADLKEAYFKSLAKIPSLVACVSTRHWCANHQ